MIKNSLIVLLALVALGASVVAWRQRQELAGLRTAAMDTTERADFQKRMWDSEKRARLLQTQLDAIRSHAAESGDLAVAASADAAPAGNPQNRMISDAVNGWLNVMNDPEAQRLMAQQQRAQISSRYAGLFRALGLPPDKLAQFKELLLEKQTVRNDVLLAATQQGINPLANPQEFRQLENSMQAEIDARIKTTLGSDGFSEFQTYQQTQAQRGVIDQLQQSLSYTTTPLSTAQSDQMVEILGRTEPAGGTGSGNPTNSAVTDATIAAAQGVLSAPQIQALQEIQRQQQAGAELQKMMRQGQGGGPTGGLPGAFNGAGGLLPGRGARPGG